MSTVVYITITGKTKRFVDKINNKYHKIELAENNVPEAINDNFILVVPSYATSENHDMYQLLPLVDEFLEIGNNLEHCKGIFAAGTVNFNYLYGITGIEISKKYNIPLLKKIEMSGNNRDVEDIEKELDNIV